MQWLKEIPSHWVIEPFGRHFSYGKGLPITKGDLVPQGVAVISYGQVHSKQNKRNTITNNLVRFVSPLYLESHPQCLLRLNDFVFADTSEDVDGSGNFAFNDYNKCIFAGYHTVVARPKDLLFPLYYAYLFQSTNWKSQIQSLVNGVKVYSINKGHLKKSYLLIPPLAEQEKIVSCLEDKTSKIDAYVAEKEKEILLLQKLKQKTIADAVTKGLNPDVKMKDSGISWIGMIPEQWEMKQLRSFLTLFTEKDHGDAQLLSVTREQGVIERDKDDKEGNHNYVPDDLSGYKYIEKGDFAINKMKAWQGSYAVSEYYGIVSPAYYTCKLKGVNKDFFSKAIRSKAYIPFFTQYSKGIRVGQWDLNPNALKSIPFILPSVDEQRAIVAYIDEKCQKIDTLVSELQAEIDNMKEYKQRLIADCVTGQVNVQNETI